MSYLLLRKKAMIRGVALISPIDKFVSKLKQNLLDESKELTKIIFLNGVYSHSVSN